MKIRVDEIPDDGLSLDLKESPEALVGLAGHPDFKVLAPVAAHLDITATEGNVFVLGNLKARLGLECSRCLKEFEHDLETDFHILFVKEEEAGRDVELRKADMDVNYLEGPELDTTELVLAQIALELPINPLCKDDCKGLCPRCGTDLNVKTCKCSEEHRVDPRLAALKGFKVE